MAEAVIVEAVRSPIGKRNGGLSGVHAADLSAQVLNALAQRAGIDPGIVDDVIWGCVSQAGEQALDIARTAALTAGWPETVPGVTVDRQCGSSQQSIHFAAAGVVAGHYDVVVAGGVESMSRTPMGSTLANGGRPFSQAFLDRYHGADPQPRNRRGDDRRAVGVRPDRGRRILSRPRTKKQRQHRIPVPSTTRSWRSQYRRSAQKTVRCSRMRASDAALRSRRWPS